MNYDVDENNIGSTPSVAVGGGVLVEPKVSTQELLDLIGTKVDKDGTKSLSANNFTDVFRNMLIGGKIISSISDSIIDHTITFTFTDGDSKVIDLEDLVIDVSIDGATLDATTNILTLSGTGQDVIVDLSIFATKTDVENSLNLKTDKEAGKSLLDDALIEKLENLKTKVVENTTLDGNIITILFTDSTSATIDLTKYLDNVKVSSVDFDQDSNKIKITNSDAANFEIDLSSLLLSNTGKGLIGNGSDIDLEAKISSDANNSMSFGSDNGLFVASPPLETTTILEYDNISKLTYTDETETENEINLINLKKVNVDTSLSGDGSDTSLSVKISSDANNNIQAGTDGGLFFEESSDINTTITLDQTTNIITYTDEDGDETALDLSKYLDNTDTYISSATLDQTTNILTLTLNDSTSVTVDLSILKDDVKVESVEFDNATRILKVTDSNNDTFEADLSSLATDVKVESGEYDSVNKKIVLTLSSGNTIDIPVSDLLKIVSGDGLEGDGIDSSPIKIKLSSDADNALVLGSDKGIFVKVDNDIVTSLAYSSRKLTYTDEEGSESELDLSELKSTSINTSLSGNGDTIPLSVKISSDVDNNIQTGSDGGLFFEETDDTVTSISLDQATNIITYVDEEGSENELDLSKYLDNSDTYISGGVYSATTKKITITLNDSSTLDIDLSSLEVSTDIGLEGNGTDSTPIKVKISADANNTLGFGTDNGLYVSVPAETLTTLVFDSATSKVTYKDEAGTSNEVDLSSLNQIVSTDSNNQISLGSDNGFYSPIPFKIVAVDDSSEVVAGVENVTISVKDLAADATKRKIANFKATSVRNELYLHDPATGYENFYIANYSDFTKIGTNDKRKLSIVSNNFILPQMNETQITDTAITKGSIRYNNDTNHYEGFNGTERVILDNEAGGGGAVEDSGWIDLVLENGWVKYATSYYSPAYRIVGNHVQFRGMMKDGSEGVFAYAPTTITDRISKNSMRCVWKGDSGSVARVYVNPDGRLIIFNANGGTTGLEFSIMLDD